MTKPIRAEDLGFRKRMELSRRSYKRQREQAEKNLYNLHTVPTRTLTEILRETEKKWGRRNPNGDTVYQIVRSAMSHGFVPKIKMLKSVIELREQIKGKKHDYRKKIIDKYLQRDSTDIQQVSRLNDYLN